jgi:hypothetical protein
MENEPNNQPFLLIQKPQELLRLFEQMIDEKINALLNRQQHAAAHSTTYENTASPFLCSQEVQQIFNVSRQTINDWRKSELLHSFKIKSRRYFFKEQVEQLRQQMHKDNSSTGKPTQL